MALGLLGAIGTAFPAIQRGIDDQKARDALDEDRAYQREQRDAARADRAFGLQQRDRQVAEQTRQDTLRRDLAAVPQTREIDTRPQAVREITVDDGGTPSATQIPAMKTVAAPDWMKLKATADVLRRNQEFEKADAYTEAATRAQFAESARRFGTVRSGAEGMSLEQLATAAADVYNNDPLPAQIKAVKPVAGGVQFTFENSDTGASETLVVKDKNELLARLESYYSPATFAAYQQSVRDAQTKTAAELAKPRDLAPGAILADGRGNVLARNTTPTAAQVRAGMGGAGGSGSGGKGGKAVDLFKPFEDAWDSTIKSSETKFGSTTEASRAREMGRQIFADGARQGRPVDPQIAVSLATQVALGTKPTVLYFEPSSGQFVKGVQHDDAASQESSRYALQELGAPGPRGSNAKIDAKQAEAAAAEYLQSLPEASRTRMLAASVDKNSRQQLRNEMEAKMRSTVAMENLSTKLGRQATKADVDKEIKEADALVQRHLDLLGNYAPGEAKAAALKPPAAAAAPAAAPAGSPPATPPVGGLGLGGAVSMADRKRAAEAKLSEMNSAETARVAALRQAAPAEAARLLADQSPQARAALAKLQASEGFQYLDRQTQLAVWTRVNQGR